MAGWKSNHELTDRLRRLERERGRGLPTQSSPNTSEDPCTKAEVFTLVDSITKDEKNYFEQCKSYYKLTEKPLISVSDEVFNKSDHEPIIKIAVDIQFEDFVGQQFNVNVCRALKLQEDDLSVNKVCKSPLIIEFKLHPKVSLSHNEKSFKMKAIYDNLTPEVEKELGLLKIFFFYLGSDASLDQKIQYRNEIRLNPNYNRCYRRGDFYWEGPLLDGKNRGKNSYYCPVGWKRYSFYVTENFDQKFDGWSICYHGTKFCFGLSILLSGLKPAQDQAWKEGVYCSPSINYAAHPRYAEIRWIDSNHGMDILKAGFFVQFVLECRVHPDNFKKYPETLLIEGKPIDPNISNAEIEWVVNNHGKSLVDFNDPESEIVCTGVMIRVTDEHPGLLDESEWWFRSKLLEKPEWRSLKLKFDEVKKRKQAGATCKIVFP